MTTTNGEIKIESGVPIPENRGIQAKYPFSEMKVGDSFFLHNAKIGKISSAKAHWERKLGAVFAIRTVDGGVRVWRTK